MKFDVGVLVVIRVLVCSLNHVALWIAMGDFVESECAVFSKTDLEDFAELASKTKPMANQRVGRQACSREKQQQRAPNPLHVSPVGLRYRNVLFDQATFFPQRPTFASRAARNQDGRKSCDEQQDKKLSCTIKETRFTRALIRYPSLESCPGHAADRRRSARWTHGEHSGVCSWCPADFHRWKILCLVTPLHIILEPGRDDCQSAQTLYRI